MPVGVGVLDPLAEAVGLAEVEGRARGGSERAERYALRGDREVGVNADGQHS
jgi:hypothetical protein